MKEFRDLTISGNRELLVATVSKIEGLLNDGWSRNKQVEVKTKTPAGLRPDQLIFCFACTPTTSRKGALLVLMSNREENLYLSNIVPDEFGQLTQDEFNYILEEFLSKFVRPAAEKTGVSVETSSGVVTVDEWFSPETVDKLRRFLKLSHGSRSRPDDDERWLAFLVSAHREGAKIHGDRLRRWLEEDAGCNEYYAEDLASDYDRSREILSFEKHYQRA